MNSDDCYIGIMTGNSMDAADAVALDFHSPDALYKGHASVAIPADLAAVMRRLAHSAQINVTELLQAQNALTDICAAACARVCAILRQERNLAPGAVRAVGCHGQTIAHRPANGATWQLLNGARLAEKTGLDVICDFRARDIAAGGQGAPLAPFFHQYLCRLNNLAPCTVVNIGGIANLSRINANGAITAAYDTGPGMLLLDAFYRRCGQDAQGKNAQKSAYDAGGQFAKSGQLNEQLLRDLLAHDYYRHPPPKSCGREEFSLAQLPPAVQTLPPADVQRTLLELTARTVTAGITAGGNAGMRAVFCGGGSENAFLIDRIRQLANDHFGMGNFDTAYGFANITTQQVEAGAFAYLAKCFMEKKPLQAAGVTGGKTRLAGAYYPGDYPR